MNSPPGLESNRLTKWFIFLVFAYLIGLACWAPFERINSDAGYYFFRAINEKFFHVEHGRFVLAVAETLPLIGAWMHLPLKAVLLMYSLNHVLFFALSAFICYRVSGKLNGALAISLLGFCGLKESVFTPQFELYYGLVFIVLTICCWNAWIEKKRLNFFKIMLLFFLAGFAITSHPMGFFCFLYAIILNEIWNKRFNKPLFFSILGLLILYYFWKKANVSDYEGGKFSLYFNAVKSGRLHEVFGASSMKDAAVTLWRYYPDVLVILFVALVFWFKTSAKAGLVFLGGLLFFPLSVWLQWNTNTPVFRYVEQVYYPFVFSIIIFVLWINLKNRWIVPLFFLSFLFRIYGISDAYKIFHHRTRVMDSMLQIAKNRVGQRFVVKENDMGKLNYDEGNWSYGFESMVRSKTHLGRCITIAKEDDFLWNRNDSLLKKDEYIFRMWEREKTKTLNPDYFILENGKYEYLVTEDSIR